MQAVFFGACTHARHLLTNNSQACDRLSWTPRSSGAEMEGALFFHALSQLSGGHCSCEFAMSLSTHAPPIVLRLDAGTLARKQRRVWLRGSHEQQQGGQPNNGPVTKDHSNRPQQTPQQPWPERLSICAACKILANPAPRGMGMPALCLNRSGSSQP